MVKVGFIGAGNMGSALAKAVAKSGNEVLLADASQAKAESVASEIGAQAVDNVTIAKTADYIFLAVKPQMMADMLDGIAKTLQARDDKFVLVTIAAGMPMAKIATLAKGVYPIIRIMPNIPASLGKGMILYTGNELVSKDKLAEFTGLLKEAGELSETPEHLIDAGSAISGCGPAFVYMFIEAMADGGVLCGLSRAQALQLAAQTVIGAGEMVKSGQHPAVLKDAVCSPGGTTIEGVKVLEEGDFRGTVIDAIEAAYKKNSAFK